MTREEVEQALAKLGDTADKVARFLADAGFEGERNRNNSCPIAKYLRKKFPEKHTIRVWATAGRKGAGKVAVDNDDDNWMETRVVAHSQAVNEFIHKFDRGEYPHLESNQPEATQEDS